MQILPYCKLENAAAHALVAGCARTSASDRLPARKPGTLSQMRRTLVVSSLLGVRRSAELGQSLFHARGFQIEELVIRSSAIQGLAGKPARYLWPHALLFSPA